MEVLDNGNRIKNSEDQTSASNFTCRLPRDLNIGSSSVARSKGETDVRLLVACKAQLSSEVIRWKTESLRLQKERDVARIRTKELDQVVGKFSDRTRELENRLSIAEEENKRLKGRILGSSNISALQKLSINLDKYHSYPWSDSQENPSACSNSCLIVEAKKSPVPSEDWKEVSQQLLEKMKQEMKELQELGNNFSLQENDSTQENIVEPEIFDVKACDDKLEESLSDLISETKSIKHCLLKQRKTLEGLISNIMQGNVRLCAENVPKDASKAFKTLQSKIDQSMNSVKPKPSMSQSSRHSDDSFRAFFTKHLDGCQNIDKMSKTMQLFMQSESQNVPESSRSPSKITVPKLTRPQLETEKKTTEEDRVCPICQAPFDESIPQNEFEGHVLDHLEVESASLLDQYVIL